jgi:hypothetical protein
MAGGIARFAKKPTLNDSADGDLTNAKADLDNKNPHTTSIPFADYDFFGSSDGFDSSAVNGEDSYSEWEGFEQSDNVNESNDDFNAFDEQNAGDFGFSEFNNESESKTVRSDLVSNFGHIGNC